MSSDPYNPFSGVESPIASRTEDYSPVPAWLLQIGSKVTVDIFIRHQTNFILFLKKGSTWTESEVENLHQAGIQQVYCGSDYARALMANAQTALDRIMSDPSKTVDDKASFVYQSVLSAWETAFRNPSSVKELKLAVGFIGDTADFVVKERAAFGKLFDSSELQMTEQNHGLHCVLYAVKLARHLGYTSRNELQELAIAALFHDIGKSKIPVHILEKPGPLSDPEWEEIKKHPRYGSEIASKFPGLINERVRRIILQHHERPDGSGYPQGLFADDIDMFARILHIADTFDSMTAERNYCIRKQPMVAMQELLENERNASERRLLIAFIEMMKA